MAELFKFRCYRCEKPIGVAPSKLGKVVNCPRCGVELIVPNPDAEDSPTGGPEPDPDGFRPEDLGLRIEPERIGRPAVAPTPLDPNAPNPVAYLEQVATTEAPEGPATVDEPPGGSDEPSALPEPRVEPLVSRRRGQRGSRLVEPAGRARDVVLPRTAAVAWTMSTLLGLGLAFVAGLMVGHFVWK